MQKTIQKQQSRARRHARIRARVQGTATKPRLAVYKSNQAIYAQLINDDTATTLAAVDSRKVAGEGLEAKALEVGKQVAAAAKAAGIETAVFDRGGFKYMGAVAAVATGARENGLEL